MVTGLPAARIEEWWPQFKPFVERSLAEGMGEWTANDILAAIKINEMQAWAAYDGKIVAGMVTQILNYPRKRICDLILASGERMDDWVHWIGFIKGWAKNEGCHYVRVMGRRGWLRKLGMNEFYTVMGTEV